MHAEISSIGEMSRLLSCSNLGISKNVEPQNVELKTNRQKRIGCELDPNEEIIDSRRYYEISRIASTFILKAIHHCYVDHDQVLCDS